MTNPKNHVEYICSNCGYINHWSRDEVLQRGQEVVYRGDDDDVVYTLRCKNPAGCDERVRVAVPRQKG